MSSNVDSSSAAPPTWLLPESFLSGFEPTDAVEVARLIQRLPDRQCSLDPIPARLFKELSSSLAPYISTLFNLSFTTGIFPRRFKLSYITPLIKKPGLDRNSTSSYRPISNLSIISKLLKRLVLSRLLRHLYSNNLYPPLQSAYRSNHSTETALLKVTSDLLRAADGGELSLLVLLDLSAAFDTVDHSILLQQLHSSCGLTDLAADWFRLYLSSRPFCV